jgi:ribosomal protein S18 acetylase RimI-like enzyme
VTVRELNVRDLAALLVFAARYLAVPGDFLGRQLLKRWPRKGIAVGAFSLSGEMCAFVYLDEYTEEGLQLEGFWIRSLFVAPNARRKGLGRRLVEFLLKRAGDRGIPVVRADVDPDNQSSVALFRGEGFRRVSLELTQKVCSEWAKKGSAIPWIVFERATEQAGREN